MPYESKSSSESMSASLEKGPQQQHPSCLGIVGPVHSHSIRLVMAPNLLLHLIKIASSVLGIISVSPIICFLLHNLIFAIDSSVQFYLLCVLRVMPFVIFAATVSTFLAKSNFPLPQNSIFQPFLPHFSHLI